MNTFPAMCKTLTTLRERIRIDFFFFVVSPPNDSITIFKSCKANAYYEKSIINY
jgi:hypothetical protein